MPWSEEKKVQIERAIGSIEYTSSDESDLSEGENGVQKLSGYLVKKIPWERSALAKVKRSLDDAALERLTPRARANFLPRRGHTRLTPVGLTSSGAQPVSITRPKKKACRMTTSAEF